MDLRIEDSHNILFFRSLRSVEDKKREKSKELVFVKPSRSEKGEKPKEVKSLKLRIIESFQEKFLSVRRELSLIPRS